MFAATREFIDDTYVHKSVQKSKNDKLPSSQKSRLRLTINEDKKSGSQDNKNEKLPSEHPRSQIEIDNKRWQQKLAVKVLSLHNHLQRLACLASMNSSACAWLCAAAVNAPQAAV